MNDILFLCLPLVVYWCWPLYLTTTILHHYISYLGCLSFIQPWEPLPGTAVTFSSETSLLSTPKTYLKTGQPSSMAITTISSLTEWYFTHYQAAYECCAQDDEFHCCCQVSSQTFDWRFAQCLWMHSSRKTSGHQAGERKWKTDQTSGGKAVRQKHLVFKIHRGNHPSSWQQNGSQDQKDYFKYRGGCWRGRHWLWKREFLL